MRKANALFDADIRPAAALPEDLPNLMALYRSLVGQPYCMWDEEYPDEEETLEDLRAGRVRTLRDMDGTLLAAISIEPGDEDFNALPNWKSRGRFAVLARLGVHPAHQHEGLARRMMEAVLYELQKDGCDGVRFIVHIDHAPAIALYRSLGVDFLGEARLYDLDWYCCEKRFEE